MAKKINKVLTTQPVPLTSEEVQNLGLTLSAVLERTILPTEALWIPNVTDVGILSWRLGTAGDPGPSDVNIRGAQGIQGPQGPQGPQGDKGDKGDKGVQGEKGDTGPCPDINPATKNWMVYEEGSWKDTGMSSSGAVGPQGPAGPQGPEGKQGIQGIQGPGGDPGRDGVSPSVSTTVINPDTSHPKGGTEVTITDSAGPHKFEIWNGADGAGATVTLLPGSGIDIETNGTNYIISVSADYALRSELPDLSQYATQTWVGQQGFLTDSDLTDYATKAYANDASANALSQAKSWVESQQYLTSVPDSYATKTYANDTSANVKSWVEEEKYLNDVAVTQNHSLSGDGTTEHPLGIVEAGMAANNLYGWNYTTHTWSAIPQALQEVETNNSVSGDGSPNRPVGLNGEVLTQLSKIDYKSSVTSGAGNVFTVNDGTNSNPAKNFTFSAVNYKSGQTAGYVPQQLFVVASDNEIISLVDGGAADGKGCLFFRVQ